MQNYNRCVKTVQVLLGDLVVHSNLTKLTPLLKGSAVILAECPSCRHEWLTWVQWWLIWVQRWLRWVEWWLTWVQWWLMGTAMTHMSTVMTQMGTVMTHMGTAGAEHRLNHWDRAAPFGSPGNVTKSTCNDYKVIAKLHVYTRIKTENILRSFLTWPLWEHGTVSLHSSPSVLLW